MGSLCVAHYSRRVDGISKLFSWCCIYQLLKFYFYWRDDEISTGGGGGFIERIGRNQFCVYVCVWYGIDMVHVFR